MKKYILIIGLFILSQFVYSQNNEASLAVEVVYEFIDKYMNLTEEEEYPIPKFSFYVNPLGFLQFGPTIGGELKVSKNAVLNVHSRLPTLGGLTYIIRDDVDKINGMSIGVGAQLFFGERKNKPYAGFQIQYEKLKCVYHKGSEFEDTETEKTIVFMMNGGYRFRFSERFYLNTGAFLGVARNNWVEEHLNPIYEDWDTEGSEMHPFGMLELALGIEF